MGGLIFTMCVGALCWFCGIAAGSEMHLSLQEIDELFYMPPYVADVEEVIKHFRRKK